MGKEWSETGWPVIPGSSSTQPQKAPEHIHFPTRGAHTEVWKPVPSFQQGKREGDGPGLMALLGESEEPGLWNCKHTFHISRKQSTYLAAEKERILVLWVSEVGWNLRLLLHWNLQVAVLQFHGEWVSVWSKKATQAYLWGVIFFFKCEKEEQNLPSNEEHSPEKGLQKAGREQKHVFHHKFLF